MSRDKANGKSNQQSGTPSGTSLEQAEADARPLLDRVRDTLTRRNSSRAYRTVEGRPATPYVPYPNMEEGEHAEHSVRVLTREEIVARQNRERRLDYEYRQATQELAEQVARLTPLRASTFPFLGMHSLAPTNEVGVPPRPGQQGAASSAREDILNRGPALLNHLTRRNRQLTARHEAEAQTRDSSEGHDSCDTTPPPPYVRRCHRGRSLAAEEPANNNVRPPSRRAGPLACAYFPPAPQAQSAGLTGDIGECASVAVGLNNPSMSHDLSSIVAGSRVRIKWHGGRVLRLWRGDVLIASFALDDDMHAEVGGVPTEAPTEDPTENPTRNTSVDAPDDMPEHDA